MTDPTADRARPLTATIRIEAAPEEVFPYFVDPDLLVQWLGTWAELQPEPGGLFALDMGEVPVRGTFVAVEPPNRVVFTWGVPGRDSLPPGSSTVEVRLHADGNATIVELLHHDLPDDARESHQEGWDARLSTLAGAARA